MGNPDYRLFSETHTHRWTLHDKTFCASREILASGQQDSNYLQTVFFHILFTVLSAVVWKYAAATWHLVWYNQKDSHRVPSFPLQILIFLSFHCSLTITLSHIHALSFTHTATDCVLACAWSLGREADRAILLSSTCLAHITLFISANHSQDQAPLCKTTGFMAYHNYKILNTTTAETKGQPATAATVQFCKT